jgi:hypothetical protein
MQFSACAPAGYTNFKAPTSAADFCCKPADILMEQGKNLEEHYRERAHEINAGGTDTISGAITTDNREHAGPNGVSDLSACRSATVIGPETSPVRSAPSVVPELPHSKVYELVRAPLARLHHALESVDLNILTHLERKTLVFNFRAITQFWAQPLKN